MIGTYARKLVQSWRQRGVRATIGVTAEHLLYLSRVAQGKLWDHRYGTDTVGTLQAGELEIPGENAPFASEYEAITRAVFRRMMRAVTDNVSDYVFIDLGSGKGRSLMLAARYPFKRIIGVELSPRLNAIAAANIEKYRARSRAAAAFELLQGDAADFEWPREATILFLYNPFSGPVMDKVLNRLRRSLAASPRDFWVLYRNPVCADLFDRHEYLTLVAKTRDYHVYRATSPPRT